jgi:hypothetical protein
MTSGWIGVDLDGTLAQYDGWQGEFHIGEPIQLMVDRVKQWLSEGTIVRIVTARVSPNQGRASATILEIEQAIQKWCTEHIGIPLPVTCCKDFGMIELWDDRCKQVIPNTGVALETLLNKERENRIKLATSC